MWRAVISAPNPEKFATAYLALHGFTRDAFKSRCGSTREKNHIRAILAFVLRARWGCTWREILEAVGIHSGGSNGSWRGGLIRARVEQDLQEEAMQILESMMQFQIATRIETTLTIPLTHP